MNALDNFEDFERNVRDIARNEGFVKALGRIEQERNRILQKTGYRLEQVNDASLRIAVANEGFTPALVLEVISQLTDLHIEFGGNGAFSPPIPGMDSVLQPIGNRMSTRWINGVPTTTEFPLVPNRLKENYSAGEATIRVSCSALVSWWKKQQHQFGKDVGCSLDGLWEWLPKLVVKNEDGNEIKRSVLSSKWTMKFDDTSRSLLKRRNWQDYFDKLDELWSNTQQ